MSAAPDIGAWLADAIAERLLERLHGAAPSSTTPPELLTLEDAGKLMGRTKDAMRSLTRSGEIPIIRCGRVIHIARKDIERWIADHREVRRV